MSDIRLAFNPVTGRMRRIYELPSELATAIEAVEVNAEGEIIKIKFASKFEAVKTLCEYLKIIDAPLPPPPAGDGTVIHYTEVTLTQLTAEELRVLEVGRFHQFNRRRRLRRHAPRGAGGAARGIALLEEGMCVTAPCRPVTNSTIPPTVGDTTSFSYYANSGCRCRPPGHLNHQLPLIPQTCRSHPERSGLIRADVAPQAFGRWVLPLAPWERMRHKSKLDSEQ